MENGKNGSKTQQILERVYRDHARNLINWALRKTKSREDAEDLCQEVMSRFAKMVIAKEAQGEEIKQVDAYLWQIAFNVMDDYFSDSAKKGKLVNDLMQESSIENQTLPDPDSHTDVMLEKLQRGISQLDYNLREAMIMYHLERKPISEISEHLNVSESYVKKLLYESRQKVRNNISNNIAGTEKVYRPKSLLMSFSGEEHISPDFAHITSSLSKQNICLSCYEKACSIEELAHTLGLPCAYIEFDLQWLLERGFVKRQKNKYLTTFFIYDGSFNTLLMYTFLEHKTKCLDRIVSKLAAMQAEVRSIGFMGCDRPINELLWLMIYSFTIVATEQTCGKRLGSTLAHRADGGLYCPIGIFNIDSKVAVAPPFMKKYRGLKQWECNGTYTFNDDGNTISWLGLHNAGVDLPINLSTGSHVFEVLDYKDMLYKAIKPNFRMGNLSADERYQLSQCIEKGFLSFAKNGGAIVPNFYVFTPTQRQQFEGILLYCYEEMKPKIDNLYADLRKMCRACLPKHLEGNLDFISYFCLLFSQLFITGFAFYDGRLYAPPAINDFTLFTLCMTVFDRPVHSPNKSVVKLRINYPRQGGI